MTQNGTPSDKSSAGSKERRIKKLLGDLNNSYERLRCLLLHGNRFLVSVKSGKVQMAKCSRCYEHFIIRRDS